jgi:hypothetical protein
VQLETAHTSALSELAAERELRAQEAAQALLAATSTAVSAEEAAAQQAEAQSARTELALAQEEVRAACL